jgi:hypothetical protein
LNRIVRFVHDRRALLSHWLFGASVVAPVLGFVAGAWAYAETGSWGSVRFFVLYAAPLFLAAPLWMRSRVCVIAQLSNFALVMDVVVFVASVARFAAAEIFPFSGHMLFLTYTLLTARARWYAWLAVALIAETSFFKLVLWRDQRSWMIGLVLGAVIGALVRLTSPAAKRAQT